TVLAGLSRTTFHPTPWSSDSTTADAGALVRRRVSAGPGRHMRSGTGARRRPNDVPACQLLDLAAVDWAPCLIFPRGRVRPWRGRGPRRPDRRHRGLAPRAVIAAGLSPEASGWLRPLCSWLSHSPDAAAAAKTRTPRPARRTRTP